MIICNDFSKDDLLKINDAAKFYGKVPRCMKKLVLHAYNLGFTDGRSSYEKDIERARDITIHVMEEERRIYYDNT